MSFEERLYQLRRERGISQEELANIVGVSRQAVQKWESGASQPNMDNLIAISEYFGVTLDYLLRGDENSQDAPGAQASQTLYIPYGWHYEYKSSTMLFGLPLVHINLGRVGPVSYTHLDVYKRQLDVLSAAGETAYQIGQVIPGSDGVVLD